MSKQPDTFIYRTIYLQSIIQKEYCLEVFHGPKVEVTQFPVESMTLAQLFAELFRFLPYVYDLGVSYTFYFHKKIILNHP